MNPAWFVDLHLWLAEVAVASARFLPAFILLPFWSGSVLSAGFRFPVVFLLGATLGQLPEETKILTSSSAIMQLLFTEIITGLIIAVLISLPFWGLHAAGSIIDNQRGATISSSLSPLSGIDASELANFLNLFAVVVVLESGGFVLILDMYKRSYEIWAPGMTAFPALGVVLPFLGSLIRQSFMLASPVITIFLLTEIILGVLSRYASQLNAFSLALGAKSLIGFFILFLYVPVFFPEEVLRMSRFYLAVFVPEH